MSARQDIANALNTVAGINVYPGFRESTKIGDGWIDLMAMQPADDFGYINTWHITIVMPQQINAEEVWLDNNLEALAEAVKRELFLQRMSLVNKPLDVNAGAAIRAVVIQGTREN